MILITGATGHVGNTLVHDLAAKDEDLRLFLQPSEPVKALNGLRFELQTGDIRNYEDVARACEGIDYVYHIAGLVDISPKDERILQEVNVQGTRNVVSACLEKGVKRLVYISSIHALPEPPVGSAIREAGPEAFPNSHLFGPYARSKSAATAEVYAGIRAGLDAVMLFPTGIIGPGDYRDSEMGKLIRYLLGKSRSRRFPCFDGAYDFVDVRDVSLALQAAMKDGKTGEGYLIAGHRVTVAQLYRQVLKEAGRKSIKLIMFPVRLVRFASELVLRFARIMNRKPFFTPYSIDVLQSNSEVDASKAARELGFKPRPIDVTLSETIGWMQRFKAPLLLRVRDKKKAQQLTRARRAAKSTVSKDGAKETAE